MASPTPTLTHLAAELAAGRTTSRALVSDCLTRIDSPVGEGARAFIKVHAQVALAQADLHDQMRRQGAAVSPYAGIPISIKDLFDIAGDTTTAGSAVLRGEPPATRDAPSVARLRAAGFVVIGRTNMTEFAFSGLGLNPHYDTPRNPWDRAKGRIPGGSSSGAAVSVADGMAFGALGTDTGGSCRIPAAVCGIVGFKPTASRVPLQGAYPLSSSLDSIGPLAASVNCCAIVDAVLSGSAPPAPAAGGPLAGGLLAGSLRLGVLTNYVTDGIDAAVAANFEGAVRKLSNAGARLTNVSLTELSELPQINSKGGLPAAEAYARHRARLATDAARYDPRVASRILRGREQDAADYIEVHRRRADFIERVSRRLEFFDAVLMPTVPILAPAIAELTTDDAYIRTNALMLRNPSIVNFLDGCAISIPCHEPGSAPVGLSLFGLRNTDHRLLAVAAAVEECLR
ncbi:MAG TPA: amidase [Steroidobacteraceae bacterium]|nr:amidase [Steroidobacteraceae bacterium]